MGESQPTKEGNFLPVCEPCDRTSSAFSMLARQHAGTVIDLEESDSQPASPRPALAVPHQPTSKPLSQGSEDQFPDDADLALEDELVLQEQENVEPEAQGPDANDASATEQMDVASQEPETDACGGGSDLGDWKDVCPLLALRNMGLPVEIGCNGPLRVSDANRSLACYSRKQSWTSPPGQRC